MCMMSSTLTKFVLLTGSLLHQLHTGLKGVTHKWYDIGVKLEVPDHKLKEIEGNHKGNVSRCLTELLQCWIEIVNPTKP